MFLELITSPDPDVRDQAFDPLCRAASTAELLAAAARLDASWREEPNLYRRVRALFFLQALHRYHLPLRSETAQLGHLPPAAVAHLHARRFEPALDGFLAAQAHAGPSLTLCSALAEAYGLLGFQTLADQVRRSVRSSAGNAWLFALEEPAAHPLRLRPELLPEPGLPARILREETPVRMDFSHSGWSDIFFLAMDCPQGAQVLNASIDLGVHGRDTAPRPPVATHLRVIPQPVIRLVSVDLDASVTLEGIGGVFDLASDYLGLLKAALVAGGLVPPALEGRDEPLAPLLTRVVGPGLGLELVSAVRDIPKGSRLAVSTTLLASLVALLMRATGQTQELSGPLREDERRLIASRAILGEWLGGSGGGWQDSGGLWPGIKLIRGVPAEPGDPEFGTSHGCLLPRHDLLGSAELPARLPAALHGSLVLVHGGMAADVGPILEMVSERYLLRSARAWEARREAGRVFAAIEAALRAGDLRRLAELTDANFHGPLQGIIPWAANAYSERLIARVRARFGADFWGFWMLGGMSGGGMGFWFAPERHAAAKAALQALMAELRDELRAALPFAMEPVVYDFALNQRGSWGELLPPGAQLPPGSQRHLAPDPQHAEPGDGESAAPRAHDALDALLAAEGFDPTRHERVRAQLRAGHIGLAQNRLPPETRVEDARPQDLLDATTLRTPEHLARGRAALSAGRAAAVVLAGGVGSRWTQGAGVVKALHPFCRLGGRWRTFLELHWARALKSGRLAGCPLPLIVTTSYLTHAPLAAWRAGLPADAPVFLSPGRAVGLRLVPTPRDLCFAFQERAQQRLDEQAQKVRESAQAALVAWAEETGPASDYLDNEPRQCLHPVGHAQELPNLLLNGTLARLLAERPQLQSVHLTNLDTLGADLDPALLGWFLAADAPLAFELIPRALADRGGGLARVDGRLRLIEEPALPREEDALRLATYSSMSSWIDVDGWLALLDLDRAALTDAPRVQAAVSAWLARFPTYVTLKEVKRRWGHGQEDVFPVTQCEQLWSDVTAFPEVKARYLLVSRQRGQQLKERAQLDAWMRDGSAESVAELCDLEPA